MCGCVNGRQWQKVEYLFVPILLMILTFQQDSISFYRRHRHRLTSPQQQTYHQFGVACWAITPFVECSHQILRILPFPNIWIDILSMESKNRPKRRTFDVLCIWVVYRPAPSTDDAGLKYIRRTLLNWNWCLAQCMCVVLVLLWVTDKYIYLFFICVGRRCV